MTKPNIIATGTYEDSPRTISALISQLFRAGFSTDAVLSLLRSAGLPEQVLDDPEFVVSADFELGLIAHVAERLVADGQNLTAFALAEFSQMGINRYGMFGLALQHAPSLHAATEELLRLPELTWGHSRIVFYEHNDRLHLQFEMATHPSHLDQELLGHLSNYCVVRDLTSTVRMLHDLSGGQIWPAEARFRGNPPIPGYDSTPYLGCAAHFDAEAWTVSYTRAQMLTPTLHADDRLFLSYRRRARAFSQVRIEDEPLAKQVTNILWAYTPTPARQTVARMLCMGERTLARRLVEEKTSFRTLANAVKIGRAKNYLLHSKKSVEEIAALMGYSDAVAFSRAFRSGTGASPARWRREVR